MSNFKSNKNGWMDDECKRPKKEDCCCKSNKNGWIDDEFEYDHHKEEDCFCKEKPKKEDCNCKEKPKKEECFCKEHKKEDCFCKEHRKEDKHEKEECCCKESMKEALDLLSCPTLNPHVNFNQFGFIGRKFLVGTNLDPAAETFTIDNIASPFGQFKGLDTCNCDLIKLGNNSAVFYSDPGRVQLDAFTVSYASLCDIEAIAFNYTTTATFTKADFEAALAALLDEECKKRCEVKCDECCCNNGIFNAVFSPLIPNNLVSLTAGWLAVTNARVLGRIDNVLVLSSANTNRIYFVCLDSVGFINY